MANNDDQVCFISLYFPCPDDGRGLEVKTAIQKLVENDDARIDFRLMDAKAKGPGPHV